MAIIIGCSGSTGSSLLKTILNRHPQIFSGPETNLFAFPKVYTEWASCKQELLQDITTDGWVIRKGMDLIQPAYHWQREEVVQLIKAATDFKSFVTAFFDKPLQTQHKNYWVEKTPVNAYGFQAFLDHYPDGKVIQIVRNPYDTITSLLARGMNTYYATGYYVYNTAVATSFNQDPRYYQLTYEALTAQPAETLAALFSFLAIPFDPSILEARHEKRAEPSTMAGWKHDETAAVKKSSIGRFLELPTEQQAMIKAAFASFEIHPDYIQKYDIRFANGQQLCEQLGYEFMPATDARLIPLRLYYLRDRLGRLKHWGWGSLFDYPGKLNF